MLPLDICGLSGPFDFMFLIVCPNLQEINWNNEIVMITIIIVNFIAKWQRNKTVKESLVNIKLCQMLIVTLNKV